MSWDPRYPIRSTDDLLSPSLLIFRPQLVRNIERMIRMARGADRLRPHVKTHKMEAIVRLIEEHGIHKHKCATIAEAEMVATAGGTDILVSYPMLGPNIGRLAKLAAAFPGTTFRATVDHPEAARGLSAAWANSDRPLSVLLDLDAGMGRTGIDPDAGASDLYALVANLPHLIADGLHAYDGHANDTDVEVRRRRALEGITRVRRLRDKLMCMGLPVPRVVLGGTPTFPIHAELDDAGVECSPGTCVLHDAGYAAKLPDLPFEPAAILFTRVVSRPRPGRLCLDLGHKAVGADPIGQRLTLLGVPDAVLGGQSEEHLVVDTPDADAFPPGMPVLAIPTHVCPTVALHRWAYVIDDGVVVDKWAVSARDRVLSY